MTGMPRRRRTAPERTNVPRVTERVFQAQVEQYARMMGWLVSHALLSIGSVAGFPDLVLIRREQPSANLLTHSRLVVAELKSAIGKTTIAQDEWLAAFATVPCAEVKLWRPDDESWADIEATLGR